MGTGDWRSQADGIWGHAVSTNPAVRAATPRKQAARTLWHAGRYLEQQARTATSMPRVIQLMWAVDIIAHAYNAVLGEGHVSRSQQV